MTILHLSPRGKKVRHLRLAMENNKPNTACDHKAKFASYELAQTEGIDKVKKQYGSEMRAYKCPYCPYWHLASA